MPTPEFRCIECDEPIVEDRLKAAGLCADCLEACVENHDYSMEVED